MSKLSIITINFNDQSGLEKTIQSVISQTFSDFEFIIIDGGSTDGSVAIIEKYSDKINYRVSEKDLGIYNAQNKGIKAAKGEYCLFLNSGDRLADEKVLTRVFSENYTEEIIYGDMIVDWGNGKITTEKMHKKISLYEMYIDTVWHPVSFIKRTLFEKYGLYDESYKIVADYEFFFRTIIVNHITTRYIPVPVSIFGFDGLSSNQENKLIEKGERERVWKKYLSELQITLLEKQLQADINKKRNFFYRIINKLKV